MQRRRACTVEPQTCRPCLRRRGPTAKQVRLCGSKEKGVSLLIRCRRQVFWRRTQDSNLRTLLTSTVFKTAALNHSANPPCLNIIHELKKIIKKKNKKKAEDFPLFYFKELLNYKWNDDAGDYNQKANKVKHFPNCLFWSNISPSQN